MKDRGKAGPHVVGIEETTNTQLSVAGGRTPSTPPATSAPTRGRELGLPSRELVELVRVQLDMLRTVLGSRISEEFSESAIGIRCAMYCRSEPNVSTSDSQQGLHLQLVAASGGDDDGSFVFNPDDESSSITASAEMEKTWLQNQATMVVLPDNGGLMLPLTHKNFLVGLLLVERVRSSGGKVYLPSIPVQDLFGPAEMAVIKQSAQALSMSCAMELRAIVDAAQQRMQQERLQGLLSQASKPLTTLKTLGRMLQPRLAEGEPERDMTDGVVAQGQYLTELLQQIQKAVGEGGAVGGGGARLPANSKTNKVVGGKKKGGGYAYALPSSSIGSDNTMVTWDVSSDEEEDAEVDEQDTETVEGAEGVAAAATVLAPTLSSTATETSTSTLPRTDVSELLRTLIDSSTAFLSIKGVEVVVEPDGVLSETAPCLVRGEYAVVKHILGTLLEEAVDAAVVARDGGREEVSLLVGVTKERGGVVFETGLACGENGCGDVWVVGVDIDALEDDVDEIGGVVLRKGNGACRLALQRV